MAYVDVLYLLLPFSQRSKAFKMQCIAWLMAPNATGVVCVSDLLVSPAASK